MTTWQSKLTKKDMEHLKTVAGVNTLAGVKRSTRGQNKMREDYPATEPCWACKDISRKLGLFVFGDREKT